MQDQGSWDDCPSGVVTEMAGRLRRRRMRVRLRSIALSVSAVLLISVICYATASRDGETPRASLNCRETVRLMANYHDRSLAPDVAKDVLEHLSHCPQCREHYKERYPSEVRNWGLGESRIAAVAMTSYGRF